MAKLLSRLGLLAARRPLAVIGSWLVILAVAVGAFLISGGALASSLSIPGTPTAVINDKLTEELPDLGGATGTVVFQTADGFNTAAPPTPRPCRRRSWSRPRRATARSTRPSTRSPKRPRASTAHPTPGRSAPT